MTSYLRKKRKKMAERTRAEKAAIYGLIIIGAILFLLKPRWGIIYLACLAMTEFALDMLLPKLRKRFPWLIMEEDEKPVLPEEGLKKFFRIGWDKELGWVRKPNTSKEEIAKYGRSRWSINERGARSNPGHEGLPRVISCYGDSFTFARQVNDNETWEWHLSELTKTNVMNFGVGNYGLGQALIRLKREYPRNPTKIVIMGVVPSTIVRVLSFWKHYNEFGNTFAFKPMFKLENDNLVLLPNPINTKKKFREYTKYLDYIREEDYFYERKFIREMIKWPYIASIVSFPRRHLPLIYAITEDWAREKIRKITGGKEKEQPYPEPMRVIMKENLLLRYNLFTKDKYAVKLLKALVNEFKKYAETKNFVPVFLWMPQKDDVLFIAGKGNYYEGFIRFVRKNMLTVDMTPILLRKHKSREGSLDKFYSDDSKYGGHYSVEGNKLVAREVYKKIKNLL
ncbi:hypothetical protein D6764_04605 [Candidatus Woesearchaeota archaeon]|nr:MAG: hypothetical protein D6764_04605 [Candidatus Woesearchaeota archaeon]